MNSVPTHFSTRRIQGSSDPTGGTGGPSSSVPTGSAGDRNKHPFYTAPGIATNKRSDATGAPGLTTRNKKLLGAPGIANHMDTTGMGRSGPLEKGALHGLTSPLFSFLDSYFFWVSSSNESEKNQVVSNTAESSTRKAGQDSQAAFAVTCLLRLHDRMKELIFSRTPPVSAAH